jgi:acyl carrier protein
MENEKFISELRDLFQTKAELMMNTKLKDIKSYDSLTKLILMSWLNDQFNIALSASDINDLETVSDIYDKVKNVS